MKKISHQLDDGPGREDRARLSVGAASAEAHKEFE